MKNIILLPLFLCLASCTSISVYQSAKTLPQGGSQLGMGLGTGKVGKKSDISGFNPDMPSVSGDIWGKYGFTDKLEAGLRISLFGSLGADMKYGLSSESRGDSFSAALGLSYAFASASASSGGIKDSSSMQDLLLPLYLSKDLSKSFTVYAVPRYGKRFIVNKRSSVSSSARETFASDMLGIGGGIMLNLGKEGNGRLSLEYHKLFDLSDSSHYSRTAGVGLSFDF